MGSECKREYIEHIRRDIYSIGSTQSNPLAGMLHEAIASLSAELYQKDIHFISELLQNAEDNIYFGGDTPTLELVLTTANITRESAPATLILFNNEVGFQEEHVKALCAVGNSTKKGGRNSGYIGEKGIGFKSVFLVSRTPYIISNGYRFRLTDAANNEAKIGYVVPEWVEEPIEDDLRRVYGKYELPQTMIILPLRADKVDPVREQLKQISPEALLFLSKLRRLSVRQDSENSLGITRTDTDEEHESLKVTTVNLSVGGHVRNVSQYHLVQHKFPAPRLVEERKEVESLEITIAFPVSDRINPGRFNGDIFAFLPSELASGFPFLVNADFLLVSSRETLKFDSPWNKGILSYIPVLFFEAFVKYFLDKPNAVDVRPAYEYIPTEPVHKEFQQVQEWILDSLRTEICVLIDSVVGYVPIATEESAGGVRNMFCKPGVGRLIEKDFRNILEDANAEGNPNPALRYLQICIVDEELQTTYSETLQALGVLETSEEEYIEYLQHQDWVLKLNEELYWAVVFFVLRFCMSSTYSGQMRAVPILKYYKGDGSIALASVQETTAENGAKIYFSPSKEDDWLSNWISVFKPWVALLFMPQKTVQTLGKFLQGKENVRDYVNKLVLHLSVKSYLKQLLAQLPTSTDRKFIILTTEFIYQSLQQPDVTMHDCNTCRYFPIVDDSARILYVDQENCSKHCNYLLPAPRSVWTRLGLNAWSNDIVVMSNDYISTPSTWPPSLRAQLWDKEDPLEFEYYRSFLRKLLNASDIPHLTPWAGSRYRMPGNLESHMTIEQASLLLKWLTEILSSQSVLDFDRSHFVQTVKVAEWLPTEHHGARRPSGCFDESSFGAFFLSTDIPYVNPSLAGFPSALRSLGVVTDPQKGCDAVGDFLFELSDFTKWKRYSCSLGQAARLYKYLHRFRWKPPSEMTRTTRIFVPETKSQNLSQNSSRNSWKDKESCVVYKSDGLFDETLTILEEWYPEALLPFFSDMLEVPKQATVENHCQLWMRWRSNAHEITESECTRIWEILSEEWTKCGASVRKNFITNAWVPAKSKGTGSFQLSAPRDCFIPDDLNLLSLFEKLPNLHFVWYPNNTEKMESGMNNVYSDMGVKNLSMSVQQQFKLGGENSGDDASQSEPVVGGQGILCQGLFRAILGFLAIRKYGLPSSERQQLLSSLHDVVEVSITSPLTCVYTISSVSSPVMAKEDNIMAHWSRKERKFYCLQTEDPILRNSRAKRDFCTQVAKAISEGILYEHPSIADELTDFLYVLAYSRFESSHVEYELRRKNARLFEEDEAFLSQFPCPSCEFRE